MPGLPASCRLVLLLGGALPLCLLAPPPNRPCCCRPVVPSLAVAVAPLVMWPRRVWCRLCRLHLREGRLHPRQAGARAGPQAEEAGAHQVGAVHPGPWQAAGEGRGSWPPYRRAPIYGSRSLLCRLRSPRLG
jgi:hypothetical protein